MKKCMYGECHKEALYFMGWDDDEGNKHWGMVCGEHNKKLGRANLMKHGFTLKEILAIEKEIRDTYEET